MSAYPNPNVGLPDWADTMVRVYRDDEGEIDEIAGVGHKGEYWNVTRESATTWKVSIQRRHGLFVRLFGWHRDQLVFRLEASEGQIAAELADVRTARQ